MKNSAFWLHLKSTFCLLAILIGLQINTHAQRKKEQTLLWEISGKDLKKPSYLFGTYHFADKGFIDTMKVVNEKLKSADAVVGELIIDKNAATKLVPFMMMKETTLDRLLSIEEYQLIDNYVKRFPKMTLKAFNAMKPVVVQTMLLQFTSPKTFTATNPAIDEYFQTYARANQKETLGLETAEDQAAILFGTPLQRQKEQLLKFVKQHDKNIAQGKKLYKYYITQDLAKLEKIFDESTDYTASEMESMLKNRNEKWMMKLPALMKEQSLFIAVGAAHLVGTDGLIKGLQRLGYKVTPLSTN